MKLFSNGVTVLSLSTISNLAIWDSEAMENCSRFFSSSCLVQYEKTPACTTARLERIRSSCIVLPHSYCRENSISNRENHQSSSGWKETNKIEFWFSIINRALSIIKQLYLYHRIWRSKIKMSPKCEPVSRVILFNTQRILLNTWSRQLIKCFRQFLNGSGELDSYNI